MYLCGSNQLNKKIMDEKQCEHCENVFLIEELNDGLCENCQERLRLERISQETFENSHGYGVL